MTYRLSAKQRRQLDALTARFEPVVRDAFLAVADQIIRDADFTRLMKAIETGSVRDVLRSIGIQAGSFNALGDAMAVAYAASGTAAMAMLPLVRDARGFKVNFQFNARNLRAERRLSGYLSGLIQDFTKEAEAATRATLAAGLKAGRNPRQVAQELIGVYDPAQRKRVGGALVLNRNQAEYVQRARAELSAGNPQALANYLTRTRRDKRFDGTVMKAMRGEIELSQAQINKLTLRYSERLLITRANTIGQTEVMEALNSARMEAGYQAAEQAGVDPDQAEKVWIATTDSRTRDQHAHMNGVSVVGMDTPFTMPDGTQMQYPMDNSLGAGASQTINCRCTYFVRLNFFARKDR
ncbi:phage minor head protein [Pseudochrobactrum asaccharolyticum]|uniref:Phage Mu protein F like protein n=1 Tax=Pseudochrobactrum asaccharolyticum TaxID=354351 RepID=A0A366DHW7_9HYPH|nr:phage minor head protein [Pseudochrobactrum asaccharolyticum]RBO89680.1 phage Mu protein F like protein [Pseudochrobactrum asaccharolyticum]